MLYQNRGVSPRAHAPIPAGETTFAIQSYEKSLAINPKNDAGRVALAKLRETKSP